MRCSTVSILLVLALARRSTSDDTQDTQNTLFDSFLETAVAKIADSNLTSYSIGSYNLFFVTATDGVMTNLSTLERVGDVNVTQTSSGPTYMKGTVTFSDLSVTFSDFVIGSIVSIDGGETTLSISTNTAYLDVVFNNSTNCTVELNEFSLTSLSGFSLSFGSSSIFGWVFELIAPTIINLLSSTLIDIYGNTAFLVAEGVIGTVGEFC